MMRKNKGPKGKGDLKSEGKMRVKKDGKVFLRKMFILFSMFMLTKT